jgi:hypothetical protein
MLVILRTGDDPVRAGQLAGVTLQEWQELLRVGDRHSVSPLLYQRLKSLDAQPPPEILQALRNRYLQTVCRNMCLYHELTGVLEALHRSSIPAMPIKGAYLAERVYGNVGIRTMADVDLLVKKADVPRAQEVVAEMNFKIGLRGGGGFFGTQEWVGASPGQGGGSGWCLEVHWWDVLQTRVDIEGLWGRARLATLAGAPIWEMCPEDLLLHVCVHSCRHVFDFGIRPICDVAEIIRCYQDLDWSSLQQRARQWAADRCLYIHLWLAKELLSAPVPEGRLEALQPQPLELRYLMLARERTLLSKEVTDQNLVSSSGLAQLFAGKGILRRAVRFLRKVFPSRQAMAESYPVRANSLRLLFWYRARLRDLWRRRGQSRVELSRHVLKDWLFPG